MEDLFQAVRAECSAGTWSDGVEHSRRLAITGVSSSADEIVCRVKIPERVVPATVRLYPEDAEWDCDCDGRTACCDHVAAAVIAVKKARSKGIDLPQGLATSAKLVYRFSRHQNELKVARILIRADGSEIPLRGTLASAVARKTAGVEITPSREDLSVDRLLGQQGDGPLHRDRVWQVLKLLSSAPNIEFAGNSVRIATEKLKPHALVTDAESGGFEVVLSADPRITEVIASGIALAGEDIHQLAETDVTGRRLEKLPDRKVYKKQEVLKLLTEVLPELKRRFQLDVQTTRLPKMVDDVEPRIIVEAKQKGGTLAVLATLVYGDPPIARIDGHRLVHLGGAIPIRKEALENRAIHRIKQTLGIGIGRRIVAEKEAATAMAQRLDLWKGEVAGSKGRPFIQKQELQPHLSGKAEGLGLSFQAQGGDGKKLEASADAVAQAWHNEEALVPLLGGGWAPMPTEFLTTHAETLATLMAARDVLKPEAPIAAHALPALAALYAELDAPPPAALAPICDMLKGLDNLPKAGLPGDLTATLRDYQKHGIDWLALMRKLGLGATLADDMGLGKTLQTLCVMGQRSLVVAPTSVVHNWAAELTKFRPSLTYQVYHGRGRKLDSKVDVTLTSYALLRLDLDKLLQQKWNMIVLDEAQMIKNPESKVAQAAFQLRAPFRVTLSGTPVENRLEELWSQFHFTNPGLLGGRSEFQEQFAAPIYRGDEGAAQRLRRKIGPFLLRRDKRTVAPELPPRTDLVEYCVLSADERQLYDSLLAATQKDVVEQLRAGGSVMKALEALLRLRQAACHPSLVPGQTAASSAKLERLASSLEAAQADGHKCLVFSQWTSFLDLAEPALKERGITFNRLDGSTRDRQGVVSDFQAEGGPSVMLLSLKAGGTGLNLTAADHVFMLDLWWNPAVEQQAADRAHRIGQTRPVFVHRLIAKDTVEERIAALQEKKRSLADAVLSEAAQAGSLTRDDLLALLE